MKIKEAVKLTGKSRTSILRALNDGKISGEKDAKGAWGIQPVDLLRYYSIEPSKLDGEVSVDTVRTPVNDAPRTPLGAQVRTPDDAPEIKILEAKLEAERKLVEDRGQTIEDLRTRLDRTEDRYEAAQTKLTALITDMRVGESNATQKPAERPRTRAGFWVALGVVVGALALVAAFLTVPALRGLVGLP